jgi:hypothetical protein
VSNKSILCNSGIKVGSQLSSAVDGGWEDSKPGLCVEKLLGHKSEVCGLKVSKHKSFLNLGPSFFRQLVMTIVERANLEVLLGVCHSSSIAAARAEERAYSVLAVRCL